MTGQGCVPGFYVSRRIRELAPGLAVVLQLLAAFLILAFVIHRHRLLGVRSLLRESDLVERIRLDRPARGTLETPDPLFSLVMQKRKVVPDDLVVLRVFDKPGLTERDRSTVPSAMKALEQMPEASLLKHPGFVGNRPPDGF